MIALPDINCLIALFDPLHCHHEAAHRWFAGQRNAGWATCPLTENGFVRVLSNPTYPGRRTTVEDALTRLTSFRASGNHEFWHDSLSLCEPESIRVVRVRGYRQLTDVYLLALATRNGGSLATFDRRIPRAAVPGAAHGQSRNTSKIKLTGAFRFL